VDGAAVGGCVELSSAEGGDPVAWTAVDGTALLSWAQGGREGAYPALLLLLLLLSRRGSGCRGPAGA